MSFSSCSTTTPVHVQSCSFVLWAVKSTSEYLVSSGEPSTIYIFLKSILATKDCTSLSSHLLTPRFPFLQTLKWNCSEALCNRVPCLLLRSATYGIQQYDAELLVTCSLTRGIQISSSKNSVREQKRIPRARNCSWAHRRPQWVLHYGAQVLLRLWSGSGQAVKNLRQPLSLGRPCLCAKGQSTSVISSE
jgi:hypothetical protein